MSSFIDLLRIHHDEFERQFGNQLSYDSRRAIYAMLSCKTGQQDCSQWVCRHCNHGDRLPLSCGHRHCPQCLQRTTSDWLMRQQSKLLPVHYFMVTFTLPYELSQLACRQPKALYKSMFSVAASVLKDFAKVWRANMLDAIRICSCCRHEMKCVGITRTTWPKGVT